MLKRRGDFHSTHQYKGFKLCSGKPLPFGATVIANGVNFSVYSNYADSCELVLFEKNKSVPFVQIPFFECFRVGNVFTMMVLDLDYENVEYGFCMDGPFDIKRGHWFDKKRILMDPYAKIVGGLNVWGKRTGKMGEYKYRSQIVLDDFDWGDDTQLETPIEDLIIYETHVRGFTRHKSSGVTLPGTFMGIKEKIPYLKQLGVNCIELMPIHEFDELENFRVSPVTGEKLKNYWGYSNLGFFAPKAGYAASGKADGQVNEFKSLIKELHSNGIEVFLDVVFNHTAEGNEKGPYISYRGIDNKTYYLLTPDGQYYNFSGCGNTLNCNNPIVRSMILDCLRYWVSEYHIDGFRFDLASILGRDQKGVPMASPPLLESLAFDPILGKCKLIAEAWDAAGLYQVGSFPAWDRWAEWNGKFRDDIRKFLKSDLGMTKAAALRIQGSPDLYKSEQRGAKASVNFITAHDGFTLRDLVSYNEKHNSANAEANSDGDNNNNSWNCGVEGETDDPLIIALRRKQMKNAVTLLMVSQGTPMLLAGDEMANTQFGNNNAYCQDNDISWLNWDDLSANKDVFEFFCKIINFRRTHPVLRNRYHLKGKDYVGSGLPDISWHGVKSWKPDFSATSRTLAFLLCGKHAKGGSAKDNSIYVAINTHWKKHHFQLPKMPNDEKWYMAINTAEKMGNDIYDIGDEKYLTNQRRLLVEDRSIVVLLAKV